MADLPSRPELRPQLDQILADLGFEDDQIKTVTARFPPAGQWSLPSETWIGIAQSQRAGNARKRRR